MKKHLIAALASVAAATFSTAASATDFSFTGTFLTDDGKAAFDFSLASAATVTIQSFGYSGGVNAAGRTIAAGGFDGVFSLYDVSGQNIAYNDDGSAGTSDPLLSLSLAAGSYKVFLTQYDNFGPANLALPFVFDGQPAFRGGFVDFGGSQRNGSWAVDISNVTTAAVPEGATWAMMLVGFGAAGFALRSRRRVAVSFG